MDNQDNVTQQQEPKEKIEITKEIEKTFKKVIDKVRLKLLNKKHSEFFSTLVYDFSYKLTNEIETINYQLDKNDSPVLSINPIWFNNLYDNNPQYCVTSIAHIILHYALQHDLRGQGLEYPNIWQNACDQVVNNLLLDLDFELLPEEKNFPERRFNKKDAYSIYNDLLEEMDENNDGDDNNSPNSSSNSGNNRPLGNDIKNPQNTQNNSNGNGNNNGNGNGNNQSKHQQQQLNEKLKDLQQQRKIDTKVAYDLDKSNYGEKTIGNSGDDFEKLFKLTEKSYIDWKTQLHSYVDTLTTGGLNYSRFNRRMVQFNLYLPDTIDYNNEIENITVAIDVSGSVTQEQIKQFLNEVAKIKKLHNPKELNIIGFNHRINQVIKLKENDSMDNVTLKIDGGTNVSPVFDLIEQFKSKKEHNYPKFLIVFSDLYFYDCPKTKPKYPVIWISVDNTDHSTVNFGKVIDLKLEDDN